MSNWLKYYEKEEEVFAKWKRKLSITDSTKLIRQLSKYCRLDIEVNFRSAGDNGWSWAQGNTICLNSDLVNCQLIVHEIAHIWLDNLRRYGLKNHGRDHCQDHWSLMEEMFDHIERKNWVKPLRINRYIAPEEAA